MNLQMDELEKVVTRFVNLVNDKDLVLGEMRLRLPINIIVPEPLHLSKELLTFYSMLEITDMPVLKGAFCLTLYDLSHLVKGQEGWRWNVDLAGNLTINNNWDENHILIGDRNDDAIFADVSVNGTPIYWSLQGDNTFISKSFAEFLDALCDCILVETEDFDGETLTEDYSYKQEFLSAIEVVLEKRSECVNKAGFMSFFFG